MGTATAYFGGEGYTTNNESMMDQTCSNWTDYWENMPQIIAPIQHLLA
ncbi:MAG: hypothetical protein QFF03_17635 [Pseudomonadota bacterium]|nr:hypothetical protein [Pseudomonadota bacterium]